MCGVVVVMHRSSGQYLATGGTWTARAEDAIEFTSTVDATRFLTRHACEPAAWDLVAGEGDAAA